MVNKQEKIIRNEKVLDIISEGKTKPNDILKHLEQDNFKISERQLRRDLKSLSKELIDEEKRKENMLHFINQIESPIENLNMLINDSDYIEEVSERIKVKSNLFKNLIFAHKNKFAVYDRFGLFLEKDEIIQKRKDKELLNKTITPLLEDLKYNLLISGKTELEVEKEINDFKKEYKLYKYPSHIFVNGVIRPATDNDNIKLTMDMNHIHFIKKEFQRKNLVINNLLELIKSLRYIVIHINMGFLSFDKFKDKILNLEECILKNRFYYYELLENDFLTKDDDEVMASYKLKDKDIELFKEVLDKGIIDYFIDFVEKDIKSYREDSKKSIEQIKNELKEDKGFIEDYQLDYPNKKINFREEANEQKKFINKQLKQGEDLILNLKSLKDT